MKKFLRIVTVFLVSLSTVAAYAVDFRRARPTLDDVFAASCRVSVEGARGSGLFVCYQGNKAYVLTNYHVVQNNATARLDFWTNHTRQSVTGRVVKRFSDRRANLDFAIIEVNADDLKKIDPPFIPLAPVDPNSLTGRKIYAAGGPKGWFVQSWKGSNESVESGLVLFSPHPVPGQSGSGVCTIIDGEIYAVEVLTYLLGDENSVLTVSCKLCGEYGERNVFIGVPTIIGRNGVKEIVELDLTEDEMDKFRASVKVLNENFDGLEL